MTGGYSAVIFPRDEPMIVVRHGPPGTRAIDPDDPVHRGVAKIMVAPTFAAVDHTKHFHSELVIQELKPRMDKTIGLVGTTSMAYAFLDHIKGGTLGNANFVDAADLVDDIKAIKSEEEIEFIKRATVMPDASMERVLAAVKNFELSALPQYDGQLQGSEQGLFLAGSTPVGTPSIKMGRHMQGREIQNGDQFTILIENNGPGGFYAEIGHTCVLGKAPAELTDEFEFTLEAQRFTLDLMNRGRPPAILSSPSTPSCAKTAGSRNGGFIPTGRAMIWWRGPPSPKRKP
jgi:Xaa-Pro aminopeptidase